MATLRRSELEDAVSEGILDARQADRLVAFLGAHGAPTAVMYGGSNTSR